MSSFSSRLSAASAIELRSPSILVDELDAGSLESAPEGQAVCSWERDVIFRNLGTPNRVYA